MYKKLWRVSLFIKICSLVFFLPYKNSLKINSRVRIVHALTQQAHIALSGSGCPKRDHLDRHTAPTVGIYNRSGSHPSSSLLAIRQCTVRLRFLPKLRLRLKIEVNVWLSSEIPNCTEAWHARNTTDFGRVWFRFSRSFGVETQKYRQTLWIFLASKKRRVVGPLVFSAKRENRKSDKNLNFLATSEKQCR
jgi:hypothetical protein